MSVQSYNSIYLQIKPFPNDGLSYNTSITVREMNKIPIIIDTIHLYDNTRSTNIGNLQNGTTYEIKIVTASYLGISSPLIVNKTVPRMGKIKRYERFRKEIAGFTRIVYFFNDIKDLNRY